MFKDATWANAPMVKRVVAVGGDTVSCCQQGKLKVNGKVIDEPYLPAGTPAEISDFQTVTVPEGRLFLLGDERRNSVDSTAHLTDAAAGTVSRGAVDAAWTPWPGRWTACWSGPPASGRWATSPRRVRCGPWSSW